IDGDLGMILAGDATTQTMGLAALTVQSLGRYGLSTGAPALNTRVVGKLGPLWVKSDVVGAFVDVQGGADGDIGSVKIGGSILGGLAADSGRINSQGDMGPVSIGGDLVGGLGLISGAVSS